MFGVNPLITDLRTFIQETTEDDGCLNKNNNDGVAN